MENVVLDLTEADANKCKVILLLICKVISMCLHVWSAAQFLALNNHMLMNKVQGLYHAGIWERRI